jgi:hypothetical protein
MDIPAVNGAMQRPIIKKSQKLVLFHTIFRVQNRQTSTFFSILDLHHGHLNFAISSPEKGLVFGWLPVN